jgi:hypothetical protein
MNRAIMEKFLDGAMRYHWSSITTADHIAPLQDSWIETLKAYKTIKHEMTEKNGPEGHAYIKAFHKSIKEN